MSSHNSVLLSCYNLLSFCHINPIDDLLNYGTPPISRVRLTRSTVEHGRRESVFGLAKLVRLGWNGCKGQEPKLILPLCQRRTKKVSYHWRQDSNLPVGPAKLKCSFEGVLNDKMVGFYRSKYTQVSGHSQNVLWMPYKPLLSSY
jgi:hypothetical protein